MSTYFISYAYSRKGSIPSFGNMISRFKNDIPTVKEIEELHEDIILDRNVDYVVILGYFRVIDDRKEEDKNEQNVSTENL